MNGIRASLILPLVATGLLSAASQADYATQPPLPKGMGSILVRDSQGVFVGRLLPQKRYWVGIDRIPAFLQQALLAVEDARFYEHNGIDLRGIARAIVRDVAKGELAEGGSTITQQLIKNKYLSSERTFDRKIKEASLAMEYEKKYTKRQILEMYFNEIYFGNGAQGLVQAARTYFDKNPDELSESECALLAGVPKNPSRYNPFGKPEDVTGRRDVVLKRMQDLNLITPQKAQSLKKQGLPNRLQGQAPQYLAQIRNQLVTLLGAETVERGGLDVTSAMDLTLQRYAEQVLQEGVKRLSPDLQGALLCLDPTTGDVLAAVGSADGQPGGMNRAFAAKRQPGSAIKPVIYAAAIDSGITASSRWSDEAVAYPGSNGTPWKPLNYGKEQFGELTLRQALTYSNNVITVKLLDSLGVPTLVDFAGRMGLSLNPRNGLSLALGTDEISPADLARAYTCLAAQGTRSDLRTILSVTDRKTQHRTEVQPVLTPAISPQSAFITTQMLKDVLTLGTAKLLRGFSAAHPAAGKTGTTDNYVDAWFVGYTPRLVTAIWIGHDQPKPGGKGFTGGAVAAPIWERFMRKAVSLRPADDFAKPETVASALIDPATGQLARTDCPTPQLEHYLPGTEPTEPCTAHAGDPLPQPLPPPPMAPAPEQASEPPTTPPAPERDEHGR